MNWMDQDFDNASADRIEQKQKKARPLVDKEFFNSVVSNELKKNRKCVSKLTPFSPEDLPSNSDIVQKQQPEKPPSKKKREPQQVYQPRRGLFQQLSSSKSSNQAHDLTSNSHTSKLETKLNVEKNYARTKGAKNSPESWDSRESYDSKVAELQNNQDSFLNPRSIHFNNNTVKLSHNDERMQRDSHEISDSKVAELQNNKDNFSNSHSVHSNNNTVEISPNDKRSSFTVIKEVSNVERQSLTVTKKFSNVECSSSTVTKEISKNNGNLFSDVPEPSSGFSSPDLNGNVSSANYFTQSLPVTKEISKNDDNLVSDVPDVASDSNACDCTQLSCSLTDNCDFYIPPPKPAPTVACETFEVFVAEPNSTSLLTNLNLNKDQFQLLEDNLSENQSILHNKLDLQVSEVISAIPGEETQVLENKTTISSEEDQVHEVQSTVSSDDDQVVDSELIKEISQFLEELEFKRSMPKNIAEKILSDLKKVLRWFFNGNSVKLYGSYWYDAAITTSNINFALVTDQPVKNNFLLQMQKTLSKEMNGYKVSPFEEETNPRRSKIYFIDNEYGISCEVIYLGTTVSQHLSLSNMLKAVCDFQPEIKNLVIAIKLWAEACEINETESGKLHSVGFILLVLHYLQQLEKPLLPLLDVSSRNWGLNKLPVRNDSSVGELWLGLLKYYGYKFNWNEHVVTVTDKTPITKTSKLWDVSWIAIQDPFSKKNIAESVVTSDTAEYITSCFKRSYQYFISSPYDSDSTSSGSDNGDSQNIRRGITFKLSDCISRPPPIFCSDDDSDSENCYIPQRSAVEEPFKFSKISETSLKCVNQVLCEAYDGYILPDNQVKGREAFVDDLEKYIMKIYPGAKLKLFGSTVNGFAFKRSDLDICMTFSGNFKKNINAGSILRRLVYHLRRKVDLKNVFGLYSALIPIIKFNSTFQNWNCDLSFYNVLAVHNSKLLYKYSMMDERCRILGCAFKLLTKKTCIADCSSKTLSSYSYILMVIHFLQQVNPPVLPVMPIHDKE
ncbi:Terminal uridylyltransferase 7, partial [Araneus ventricosus]